MGFGSPKEIITSETLQSVYDIEMDVITTHDRYGRERTICLPVNSSPKHFRRNDTWTLYWIIYFSAGILSLAELPERAIERWE